MSEETAKPETNGNESNVLGISIRGWLASILVLTVCIMSAWKVEVTEPLYSMATLALGFYFGQKVKS